jgi:hypothetical protein
MGIHRRLAGVLDSSLQSWKAVVCTCTRTKSWSTHFCREESTVYAPRFSAARQGCSIFAFAHPSLRLVAVEVVVLVTSDVN